jgi:hypothetical protein
MQRGFLESLRAFCFPGGEDAARRVHGVKLTEKGDFRSAPGARWISFEAELEIDATRTRFRWEARFGGAIGLFRVTDAYENGHGLLSFSMGGLIPVKKMTGPELDQGELQRYLASLSLCPPMLLNNPGLIWSDAGSLTLRVQDRLDPAKATVDVEISEQGCPVACRATRPRLIGKQPVLTPWAVKAGEFREWEGLRVASVTEASWRLPDGEFTYYRSEVTSLVSSEA